MCHDNDRLGDGALKIFGYRRVPLQCRKLGLGDSRMVKFNGMIVALSTPISAVEKSIQTFTNIGIIRTIKDLIPEATHPSLIPPCYIKAQVFGFIDREKDMST